MPLEFADTSTHESLYGTPDATTETPDAPQDANVEPLDNFDFSGGAATTEEERPAFENTEEAETTETETTETPAEIAAPDYKTAYTDFMKAKGVDVTADELGENFGEEEMNRGVQEYYASQYIKDPLMLELAKKGLSIEDHFNSIAPLQQQLQLDDKALYTQNKVAELFEADVKLGKIDKDNEQAVKTALAGYQTAVTEKLANVPDDILKGLVDPIRAQINSQVNELPSKIQVYKQEQFEIERTKKITEYTALHTKAVENIAKEIGTGKNFGLPFKSQADKDDFKNYYDQQLKFGDIAVKDESGKESTVQDIPFWHKLNTDQGYLNKVLRVMHAMDKGNLTDIKNTVANNTVKKLALEPIVGGLNGGKNTQTSRWADTSKAH